MSAFTKVRPLDERGFRPGVVAVFSARVTRDEDLFAQAGEAEERRLFEYWLDGTLARIPDPTPASPR